MHERSYQILKNLGYDDKIIDKLKNKNTSSRKTLTFLKSLGIPSLAIKQIKSLEKYHIKSIDEDEDLNELLIKRCKRSFDALAAKGVDAYIVFHDNTWTIYSDIYCKAIERLHCICKPYFDKQSSSGIRAILSFNRNSWKFESI